MKRSLFLLAFLATIFCVTSKAQNPPAAAIASGTALPATCQANNRNVFVLISGSSGTPYYCSAPNTWSLWSGGGGGGSPAGPPCAVQFDNSGSFGGNAAFCWDNTDKLLQIGGSPITPFAGEFVGPNESTLPAGVQDWTAGIGGTQNVLITSTGLTGLQIEAGQDALGSSSGVLSVVNFGKNTPSAIYTENHSIDDSLNLAIQGTAYAEVTNTNQIWGGYFTAGVLQNVNADAIGGIVFWQPLFRNGGTATTYWSSYAQDLGPVAASITNPYYSWLDSRGVRRVKEDSTFNSVGQAIEALYNPQFTKYTPGAADYERIILGQWESNVAVIGPESGGTGTLRGLELTGSTLTLEGVVPAMSGNRFICISTTGLITSSATACVGT